MVSPQDFVPLLVSGIEGAVLVDTADERGWVVRVGAVDIHVDVDREYPEHFYWSVHTPNGRMHSHRLDVCWDADDVLRVIAEVKAKLEVINDLGN